MFRNYKKSVVLKNLPFLFLFDFKSVSGFVSDKCLITGRSSNQQLHHILRNPPSGKFHENL